jgi:site-specific DNA recombinase
MKPQAALYARCACSEPNQQHNAKTIASQVADLRTHMAATGVTLSAALEFVDNGWSGVTLTRPALQRLRDVVATGGIDSLYVLCPDRLARTYTHLHLLLQEFAQAGVSATFLNQEAGPVPADQVLLHIQAMMAEEERATLAAHRQHGEEVDQASVLPRFPYGYRLVSKETPVEIVWEEAQAVREGFHGSAHTMDAAERGEA